MARPISPESRERLLAAAEGLFHQHGYHAVSMADIAAATGIRKASLYHHVPGGKEELFIEIASRAFARHKEGLASALGSAETDLHAQLRAAAAWFISQAPLGLLAMLQNDMPALEAAHVQNLKRELLESLWLPLIAVFEGDRVRGEIADGDTNAYVGAFVSMMDGLTYIGTQGMSSRPMAEVAEDIITMMVRGLKRA
jgi:AcrR family transcriptional regulator